MQSPLFSNTRKNLNIFLRKRECYKNYRIEELISKLGSILDCLELQRGQEI